MVETYKIKITQDAIAVLLTSDGTEVRFKDEPTEALKDIFGLVNFAPNSMVSQRLIECKGQSFDLPNPYTAQVKWYNPCIEHKKCLIADDQNRNNCAQLHGNKCQKEYRVAVLTLLKQSGEPATAEKISAGNEAKKEDKVKKRTFVKEVSDHFNGGDADTAKLYDVAKFMERVFEDSNKQIQSLEEMCKQLHYIITHSKMLPLERTMQEHIEKYTELYNVYKKKEPLK